MERKTSTRPLCIPYVGVFGGLLLASCGSPTAAPAASEGTTLSLATAALTALEDRDLVAVERCRAASDRCAANLPDAAPAEVCVRLSDHCTRLEERLSEVREPAVGCLRAVQECEAHTPEHAACRESLASCGAVEDDVAEERDPVVSCNERVAACLARAAEVPQSGAACEPMAESCDRIGGAGGGSENAADAGAAGQAAAEAAQAREPGAPEDTGNADEDTGDDADDDAAESETPDLPEPAGDGQSRADEARAASDPAAD
jgi:hypothetical protein